MALSVPRTGAPRGYRCAYCGAPLRVGPDTVVTVCPYCGKPNWIRGKPSDVLATKTVSADEAREGFFDFAKRDPDLRRLSLDVARVEIVFLPFYESRGRVAGDYDYTGYVSVTRTVKRGDKYVTETARYPFHERGRYETGFRALVSAKRALGEEAADELAEHYLGTRPSLHALSSIEWRRGEYSALAADYDAEEARSKLMDDVCDWFRRVVDEEVKRRVSARHPGGAVHVTSRMVSCEPDVREVKGPILLPLVKVFYIALGKVYRAYFAGWDMAPLLREEPLTGMQRAVIAGLSGLISGGAGVGGIAIAAHYSVTGGALVFIGGAIAGYLLSRAALRESRIEVGGPHSWVSSITEEIEEGAKKLEELEEKMSGLGISIG